MKLPFINEGIFEPHKSPIKIRESSYIYIYGGAREPRMDLGFQARGALLYAKKIPNKHPYQGFEFYFGYCFGLATGTKYYGTRVCFALFQNYE